MTKLPTNEQLDIAVAWLEYNEGDDGEAEACKAVASWVVQQHLDVVLRRAARKAGMPVAKVRRRLEEVIANCHRSLKGNDL